VKKWLPEYRKRLDAFLAHGKDRNLITVRYEDFHAQPRGSMHRLFSFIGLTEEKVPEIIKENEGVSKSSGRHGIRIAKTGSWNKELTLDEMRDIYDGLKDEPLLGRYTRFLPLYLLYRKTFKKIKDSVQATDKRMVFIVGIPRSGTTWLWEILAENDEVSILTREDLEGRPFDEDNRPKGTPRETNMLNDFSIEKIRKVISAKKRPFVIEKTPLHVLKLDQIRTGFPGAKIIHVVRHPVNVYASYKFVKDPEFENANIPVEKWVPLYKGMFHAFMDKIDSQDIMTVSYEEMMSDAEQASGRVHDFIGLDKGNMAASIEKNFFNRKFPKITRQRNVLVESLTVEEKEYILENLKNEIETLKKFGI